MEQEEKRPRVSIEPMTGWEWAKRAALRTVGLRAKTKEPTSDQKLQWLMSEHGHIKVVQWWVDIDNLRQWVGVHLIRHPFILPFITSQRPDKALSKEEQVELVLSKIKDDIVNDPDFDKECWRDYRLQGSTNNHSFVINAQSFINISKKRLCKHASKETREVWKLVKECMEEVDPEMAAVMVPTCVYRGWCTETPCCGYSLTPQFRKELERYRDLIPPQEERLAKV